VAADPRPDAPDADEFIDADPYADPPATVSREVIRTPAGEEYQRQVDFLRGRGCRCTLHFVGGAAVPFFVAEGRVCVVAHYPAIDY
jgi:hypothetical protein